VVRRRYRTSRRTSWADRCRRRSGRADHGADGPAWSQCAGRSRPVGRVVFASPRAPPIWGAGQVERAGEVGAAEVGAAQVGAEEVGRPQVGAAKRGSEQVRGGQVGPAQVGPGQIPPGQVRAPVIRPRPAGASRLGIPPDESAGAAEQRRDLRPVRRGIGRVERLGRGQVDDDGPVPGQRGVHRTGRGSPERVGQVVQQLVQPMQHLVHEQRPRRMRRPEERDRPLTGAEAVVRDTAREAPRP